MCNNTTLAQSEGGYVFQCLHCGLFQIAYGTTLVSLAPAQYDTLLQRLRHRLGTQPQDGFPLYKCIAIELFSPQNYLILCHKELQELTDLLHQGSFASELQRIVGDFGGSEGK
jgi:hypothetical protein